MSAGLFGYSQVCEAAGIPHSTLRNWVSSDPPAVLMKAEDRAMVGRGHALTFTFRRVVAIAITAELVRLGWRPRQAAIAAEMVPYEELEKHNMVAPADDTGVPFRRAASAVGLPKFALQNWLNRRQVTLRADVTRRGQAWRRFTFHDIVKLSVMRCLISAGISVDQANQAAGLIDIRDIPDGLFLLVRQEGGRVEAKCVFAQDVLAGLDVWESMTVINVTSLYRKCRDRLAEA